MDVLSDVLRTIRLEGALFHYAELREPWCIEAVSGLELARHLERAGRPLAVVHMILEGRCWAEVSGAPRVLLHAGDVVVIPHGDSHVLGNGSERRSVSVDHLVKNMANELTIVKHGGNGLRTMIVCGWFAFERELANPLITALPRVFHTSVGQRPAGPWMEQSIRYAVGELASGQPGSGVVAAKVAEALFVETLRGYLESLPTFQTGWLSGLRDAQVGRCLALLHDEPAHAWSVTELAKRVHVSRSVLAQRFTELVGSPPMQYLKRWRLTVAARLLSDDRGTLTEIAERVGYDSEAAFNRAFKREHGVSPGVWRRERARRDGAREERDEAGVCTPGDDAAVAEGVSSTGACT